jgi:hypothetical protein
VLPIADSLTAGRREREQKERKKIIFETKCVSDAMLVMPTLASRKGRREKKLLSDTVNLTDGSAIKR